jgi:hypothetical protein
MPGPGPTGVSARQIALPGESGIVARLSPIMPGPDGATRGDRLPASVWTGSMDAAPPDQPPSGEPQTGAASQDSSGRNNPWISSSA